MTAYELHLTYHCADDNQGERIGVAMAEFIGAEFDVDGYGITRTVPIGPPATVCFHCGMADGRCAVYVKSVAVRCCDRCTHRAEL